VRAFNVDKRTVYVCIFSSILYDMASIPVASPKYRQSLKQALQGAPPGPPSPVRDRVPVMGCPWPGEIQAGQLYTWGRGSQGQLGQEKVKYPKDNCAIPYPVPNFNSIVWVACGGGQQGCTACVNSIGQLFTFGNNYGFRLGHKNLKTERDHARTPRQVKSLDHDEIAQVACGLHHMLALSRSGTVYSWGTNRSGCLGCGVNDTKHVQREAKTVNMVDGILWISAESDYSGCVNKTGQLFMWGGNTWGAGKKSSGEKLWAGKLGLGDDCGRHKVTPQRVLSLNNAFVTRSSLGSVYAGCCTEDGALYMWGYGGHGNLGLGNRNSYATPQLVKHLHEKGEVVVEVACTVGQEGPKGDFYPSTTGNEGPHTVVVALTGGIYTFGTCHKGLLCNLGEKTGGFGEPYDELLPYFVGKDKIRNGKKRPPMSPFAAWPPPYDESMEAPVVHVVSGHIHCAAVTSNGTAWAWGCGSNDGRCGVERFLNASGDGERKPPKVDTMKCYMMQPHKVGWVRKKYWRFGGATPGLENARVLQLATGRNHMAAIALPKGERRPVVGEGGGGRDKKVPVSSSTTTVFSNVSLKMSSIQLGAKKK
jgi:alpha-tubulin suppressor-like RCC1 family protein